MNAVLTRLKEPSTWAGLAALATVFGFTTEQWDAVANGLAGVFAAAAVFLPEASAE